MSENLRTFTKALYGFDAVVQRVPADAWDQQSPCDGWTARDVVGHNIFMQQMIASLAGAGDMPADMADRDRAGDEPVAAWNEARDACLAALDQPGCLQTVSRTPWGEMPVDQFLGIVAVDPVTHTWDLARAAGIEPVMDEAIMAAGLAQLTRAGDAIRGETTFGPAVEVADDAPLMDRFIAVTGRRP